MARWETPHGNRNLHADARRLQIEQTQRLLSSVQLLKTLACIREADAPRQESFRCVFQRASEICDFQAEPLLFLNGADGNDVRVSVLADAMPDGVFYKGLKN